MAGQTQKCNYCDIVLCRGEPCDRCRLTRRPCAETMAHHQSKIVCGDLDRVTLLHIGDTPQRTWSETPAWFRTKLYLAPDASIALSFSDVSDAYQFFPSPLRSSDNLDYRANPPHSRNTDISCR